jgi:F-type H+-transporting ATPase subunit gamma
MAKARRILKRVKVVRSIHQVTRTMQMVASARFRKAHARSVAARPYTDRLVSLVADLIDRSQGKLSHPLMEESPTLKRDVLLVITSNSGLCGAFNSAVLEVAMDRTVQLQTAGYELNLHVVGKRGLQYMQSRRYVVERSHTDLGYLPDYTRVTGLADQIVGDFLAGRISGLEVAYMQFVSAGRQRPVVAPLLPMSAVAPPARPPMLRVVVPYDMLPSPQAVLDRLLPLTLRLRLYQCFLDSAVAEQMARMAAMQSASDNAEDMIHELTVLYNRMRQTQITTELSEIMGGAEGLE